MKDQDTQILMGAAFDEHDHSACLAVAMARAERICAARAARLTPIRRRVLELLWESHQPIGAYDILDKLKADGLGAQPPAVYRALDFLMAHGLAHRIASASAYIGCTLVDETLENRCAAPIIICSKCGQATEIDAPAIDLALRNAAERIGFKIDDVTLEIAGVCAGCAA